MLGLHILNVETGEIIKIDVPDQYRNSTGFYGWDENSGKVAFYLMDANLSTKLVVFNYIEKKANTFDPPEGTVFDLLVVPSLNDGKVIFSADNKLYTVN